MACNQGRSCFMIPWWSNIDLELKSCGGLIIGSFFMVGPREYIGLMISCLYIYWVGFVWLQRLGVDLNYWLGWLAVGVLAIVLVWLWRRQG